MILFPSFYNWFTFPSQSTNSFQFYMIIHQEYSIKLGANNRIRIFG